jgi:hypothetical protein
MLKKVSVDFFVFHFCTMEIGDYFHTSHRPDEGPLLMAVTASARGGNSRGAFVSPAPGWGRPIPADASLGLSRRPSPLGIRNSRGDPHLPRNLLAGSGRAPRRRSSSEHDAVSPEGPERLLSGKAAAVADMQGRLNLTVCRHQT